MALTTGHFYWSGSDAPKILLCTDATTFGFQRLPDGDVQTYAADPSAQFVDLQTMGFVAPFPTCTLDGEAYEAVEAYSTDATLPNVQAVMLRPLALNTNADKRAYVCVPRGTIPTASVKPAGALG